MFKFSTSTIINSNSIPGFANVPTANTGSDKIESHPRFWVDTTDEENPILHIAKQFKFSKKNVVGIYKRHWEAPLTFLAVFDISEIDIPESGSTIGRIALYIRLSGSSNSIYANDFVYQGKPFYIEFPINSDDEPSDIAARIVKIAKKYQTLVYGHSLVDVYQASDEQGTASTTSTSGNYVAIAGTDEYQVLTVAELLEYNENAQTYDCCAKFGQFEDSSDGIIVTQGHEGFGTYRQILKDLRLPTAANTRFTALNRDEVPVVGGHYNEYIIKQCTARGILGSDAVGEVTQSLTNHAFYVNMNVVDEWEDVLQSAFDTDIIETVDKDYDDVSIDEDTIDASFNSPTDLQTAEETAHGSNDENTTGDFTASGIDDETGLRTSNESSDSSAVNESSDSSAVNE